MKALILNSGLGSRMGDLTREHPKCMTEIAPGETILSRQLRLLSAAGVEEAVITTGYYDEVLTAYCRSLSLPVRCCFVKNPLYRTTNYIYSIYCSRRFLRDSLLLMHGDLVFDAEVLRRVYSSPVSCMTVSSTLPLPSKDFKAQITSGRVTAVGVDIFDDALAAQPLYKLLRPDWDLWLSRIVAFCEAGNTGVYAENALNSLSGAVNISALDVESLLCAEIDTPEDLAAVKAILRETR